jgi:hypothetical protein
MSAWKKVIRYSLRVDGKFENQYTTLEAAKRQAAKYQAKGKSTLIKEVEVECMSVNFGVI